MAREEVKADLLKFLSLLVTFVFLVSSPSFPRRGRRVTSDPRAGAEPSSPSFLPVRRVAYSVLSPLSRARTRSESEELRVLGAGLLFIGALGTASGLLAFFGARWEKRILLLICACGLLFLLVCCISLLLLLLLSKGQIEEKADAAVGRMILVYIGHGRRDGLLDDLQHQAECCGLTGRSDWLRNAFVQTLNVTDLLPCSCLRTLPRDSETAWCSSDGEVAHEQGCAERLSSWLHENTVTVVGLDVGLMVAQVLQATLALELRRTIGRRDARRAADKREEQERRGADAGSDAD
ncbi:CD82 antigen-like [Corythoichthys intestinalis]|uniref:CD82 antigen-like n=1 Tax=Corythoichthys intestinalis TaxID=161448 RepID=UPI0025A5E1BB|nr:CD82 antigen-like [Corythoichthys intestinalis]